MSMAGYSLYNSNFTIALYFNILNIIIILCNYYKVSTKPKLFCVHQCVVCVHHCGCLCALG